jgi:hypothetical protein
VLGIEDFGDTTTNTVPTTSSAPGGSGGHGASGGASGGDGGRSVTVVPCEAEDSAIWEFHDRFDRVVDGGWGTSSSGDDYELSHLADHYSVNGEMGLIDGNDTSQRADITSVSMGDLELVGTARWAPPTNPEESVTAAFRFRRENYTDQFAATLRHENGGGIALDLVELTDNTPTELTSIDLGNNLSTAGYRVRIRIWDRLETTHWRLKVWPADASEEGAETEARSGEFNDVPPLAPKSGMVSLTATRHAGDPGALLGFADVYVCAYPR